MSDHSKTINTYHQKAVALLRKGKLDKAEKLYIELLIEEPSFISAYNNLGIISRMRGNLEKAIEYYRKTIKLNPKYFQGYSNLANVFKMQGKFKEAEKYYREALKIEPRFADACNNLGALLQILGRLEEAAKSYEKAIKIDPKRIDVYGNLGGVLITLGRLKEAEICLRTVESSADLPEPLYNLANLLKEKGEFDEASALYSKVINSKKDYTDAYNGLLECLRELCLWKEADKIASELEALSEKELLLGARPGETPFTAITISDDPVKNLQIAVSWSKHIEKIASPNTAGFYFDRLRQTHRKIRIGYISRDFTDHPVGHIIKNMFSKHDRRKFEVYCFSFGGKSEDRFRKKIEKSVKHFVDISSMSYLNAAQRIHAEEIDILVDLMGHTSGNRLEIMAFRPAPIQINYLGFPGSIGADFIDYQIVDRVLVPEGMEKHYMEQLIFMPDCYQINDSEQKISGKNFKRSDFSLPQNAFVLCSFNRLFKITPKVFNTWARILNSVPKSVLWLQSGNPIAEENLKKEAEKRGIDLKRLIFSSMIPLEDHLKRLELADLMLDTYPYSGGATTSHALRRVIPTITFAGKTYLSRMSASLLKSVGLEKLAVGSLFDYEKIAIDIAKKPQRLKKLKKQLKKNLLKSKIFDTKEFVKNLEFAYQIAWKLYKTGQKHRSIEFRRITSEKPE